MRGERILGIVNTTIYFFGIVKNPVKRHNINTINLTMPKKTGLNVGRM